MVRPFALREGARYQHFFHKTIVYEYVRKKGKGYLFRVVQHNTPTEIGEIRSMGQKGLRLLKLVEYAMTNQDALVYLKAEKSVHKNK